MAQLVEDRTVPEGLLDSLAALAGPEAGKQILEGVRRHLKLPLQVGLRASFTLGLHQLFTSIRGCARAAEAAAACRVLNQLYTSLYSVRIASANCKVDRDSNLDMRGLVPCSVTACPGQVLSQQNDHCALPAGFPISSLLRRV